MQAGSANVDTAVQPKSPGTPRTWVSVLFYTLIIVRVALLGVKFHSVWPLLFCLPLLVIILLLVLGPSRAVGLFFGRRSYIQIDSAELQQRIRDRYQAETGQLGMLGFAPLFAEGETFPVFRILLGFPAVILLQMRAKREVIAMTGARVVIGFPIFASGDKTSYGHPSGLGVAFHTEFSDGTLLKTANYGQDADAPMWVRRASKGASISETWTAHQSAIRSLEVSGNRVDSQFSFDGYAAILAREGA
jgi:hypothetical protein